ncbi:neuronal acetylcholine receptor subunit beta-3 isoform X2 [Patella vulgata]|uniref:neuronal acetylcholine receptor subunit beta-3 isoform X2 n=1 Tax=Patella vulgata TaxID=6465 RepID=UPI00217F94E0|nr:neuronal acetylcholine receptor subunit beta-3 isoform X2 [Patella vulgata]XP_050394709.1 neuronal acetylcholine receptor subunit beta-3 isoform X2 [Patella vulgata]XP_050394710.1 neuronal acetylcholine receptor subunit beta-3 isoform X2 [Patella vulgata]
MLKLIMCCGLLSSVLLVLTVGSVNMSSEKMLIRTLLEEYAERGKMGRPVAQQNDTLVISYGLSLIQILDLDERNQVLSTNVWATYNWNDMYLKWDADNYSGIHTIRVPTEDIWMPDIKLYNYADTRLEEKREALAVLSSDGTVVWIPQAVFKSSCSIDIRHFPFDVQTCKLKFGSWTYDGSKLDLLFMYNLTGFEMTDYIDSNEWEIKESSAKKTTKYYPCCPEPYVDLTFTLKIKRKVAFYSYILILPCLLLSSLTLVLFWLPPESPAKMQLGMNIFVAFFVLLLLLAESTPPAASSIPLIGAYYCLNMILITLSTLLSVVVVNMYFRGSRTRVPRIFKSCMMEVFARVFCMRNQLVDENLEKNTNAFVAYNNKDKNKHSEFKYDRVGCFEMQTEESWRVLTNGTPQVLNTDPENPFERPFSTLPRAISNLEKEIKDIKDYLKVIVDKSQDKEAKEKAAREWKNVALVLDRLFFFLYLIAMMASAFTIFETTLMQET